METRNRCQGINSASLCSLAGRYDNPIPIRCLAPIDFLKIPALVASIRWNRFLGTLNVYKYELRELLLATIINTITEAVA
jgi:hypothetical protein